MAVITNAEKALVANFIINQGPMYACIGKDTIWEYPTVTEDIPPVESASQTTVEDPLVYKTVDVLQYAKLDPDGAITYRTSKYAVTSDWDIARQEGYNAIYIKVTLVRDQVPVDISYRIVAFLIGTIGTFDLNGVAFPEDITEPGTLFAIDHRRPMARFSDQSEVIEMIIPL